MALAAHRRDRIVELVRRQGVIRVADLVEQFGVSRWTVHRDLDVLSEQGLIMRARGGAVAAPTHSSVSNGPVVRQSQDASHIHAGVVVPTKGYYYGQVVQGVRSYLDAVHARLTVVSSSPSVGADPESVARVLEAGVDSLLVTPHVPLSEPDSLAWLEELGLPTVLVERESPAGDSLSMWSVCTDHRHGIGAALKYLRELGHRRVGFTALNEHALTRRLQRIWEQELVEQALDHDVPVIDGARIPEWPIASSAELDTVFEQLRDAAVTAVICHNDLAAKVIAQHAGARGWKVPGDLSIVAYDDELAAGPPLPLTAVSPAKTTVGRVAGQLLLELIDDREGPPRHVQIEPTLNVRQSTGPPGPAARLTPVSSHLDQHATRA